MSGRSVIFDSQFRDDLRWWAKKDRKICDPKARRKPNRVLDLVEVTIADPMKS